MKQMMQKIKQKEKRKRCGCKQLTCTDKLQFLINPENITGETSKTNMIALYASFRQLNALFLT